MFQDFQISLTPLSASGNLLPKERDCYLVRTEKVSPGVPLAEEQVFWDLEPWLEHARLLMADPVLYYLRGGQSWSTGLGQGTVQQAPLSLVDLGQQLYDALFQGSLRDSWIAAQSIARHQRSVLRLRVGLKGNRLASLPWEVLHPSDREAGESFHPLATGTEIIFSRYQTGLSFHSPHLSRPLSPEEPLKILMAIAEPEDQESLELHQEALHLQSELEQYGGRAKIELTILDQPSREQLTQALEQGQYRVFHYAGHSNLGESGGDVYLVSPMTGLTERIYGEDLAGLLFNNGVQLAVFNSCRSATIAVDEEQESQRERNLAQTLVSRGIPAVVAMAERIPDEVAITFTRLFYRNLAQGYPIDLSLSRTRQGLISAYGSDRLYWALPVLYLHPNFDGFLLGTPTEFLAPEDLDLDDFDDLPLTHLASDFVEGDESEFLTPLIAKNNEGEFLTPFMSKNGHSGETEESDESFIKSMLSDLAPSVQEEEKSPVTVPAPEAKAAETPPEIRKRWKKRGAVPVVGALGGISAIAIALGGVWFFSNPTHSIETLLSRLLKIPTPDVTSEINPDLSQVSTERVTSLGIEAFTQGKMAEGETAVKALLDRNVLNYAESVLATVPTTKLDDPGISFLRGRLAWQAIATGSNKYHISDARRFWEIAVKGQPDSLSYRNALGFAYYTEDQIDLANQTWYDALELVSKQPTNPPQKTDVLTTYAGLALGIAEISQTQPQEQQSVLLNKARKLYQKVMNEDPLGFQLEALSKNWLWSESAIAKWKNLGAPTEGDR